MNDLSTDTREREEALLTRIGADCGLMVQAQPIRSSPRPRDPPGFGEPAPFFTAPTDGLPEYAIQVAAGRFIVLMMFGSLANPACRAAHDEAIRRRRLFDERDAAFFGVSIDPADRIERKLVNLVPGVRYLWDFDRSACGLYGLVGPSHFSPAVFLIDRTFRIVAAASIDETGLVLDRLEAELASERALTEPPFAPVLSLPRIFEPEFCAELITHVERQTPNPSGFAREVEGRTVTVLDPRFKRRMDVTIDDAGLLAALRERLTVRLLPMVKRALGWQASEIERYLVCRYGAEQKDFFSAHRDDATPGTAHRKFAVTINLNAEDYDGGDLRFPEFGRRTYRPPTGGATVFCCSLLHEVTPVMRGVRYAFVPFLYDKDGVAIRRANLARVG